MGEGMCRCGAVTGCGAVSGCGAVTGCGAVSGWRCHAGQQPACTPHEVTPRVRAPCVQGMQEQNQKRVFELERQLAALQRELSERDAEVAALKRAQQGASEQQAVLVSRAGSGPGACWLLHSWLLHAWLLHSWARRACMLRQAAVAVPAHGVCWLRLLLSRQPAAHSRCPQSSTAVA
jgi:hypothetical protein